MAIALIASWLADPHRKFEQGKLLYDQFGSSPLLKALFAGGSDQSPYQFQRLQDELRAISDLQPSQSTAWPAKREVDITSKILSRAQFEREYLQEPLVIAADFGNPKNIVVAKETPNGAFQFVTPAADQIPVPSKRYGVNDKDWEKLPDKIKDLYTQNSQLTRHSELLFAECRQTTSKVKRLELDLQILNEREQINKNWKIIKDYQQDGVLYKEIQDKAKKTVAEMKFSELNKASKNIPTYISKARGRMASAKDDKAREKEDLKIRGWEIQIVEINARLEAGK